MQTFSCFFSEASFASPRNFVCSGKPKDPQGNIEIHTIFATMLCLFIFHHIYFKLNRDTWNSTEVQPMRDRRSFPSAVVTEDEMYVLGGYDGNDTLRSVECYSFTTLEWTQVAPMGTPRSNAGACVFNNKIYLVGGWDGISLNSVECFDVGTRVWQRMPSLPRPTTGVRCCFLSFQSTNEQKPKSRGSRGHMCIIC